MSELLPCPFCGGEADVIDYDDECWVAHQCVNGTSAETNSYETVNEAIAAWNTRYHSEFEETVIKAWKEIKDYTERTCHDEGDPSDFCCSECGARMFTDIEDTYTMIANDEKTIIKHPHYCPNCGAKVVEQ